MTSPIIRRSASTPFRLHKSVKIRFYSLPVLNGTSGLKNKGNTCRIVCPKLSSEPTDLGSTSIWRFPSFHTGGHTTSVPTTLRWQQMEPTVRLKLTTC